MTQLPRRILGCGLALCLSAALLQGPAAAVDADPFAGTAPDAAGQDASSEEQIVQPPSLQDPAVLDRALSYQALDYFHSDKLDRYLAYGAAHPELDAEDVVTRVNIGLDGAFYDAPALAEDPASITVLVNKYNRLPDDYAPKLIQLSGRYVQSGGSLTADAGLWFMRMADAARREGITLKSVSAYRSYSYQATLYRRYAAQDGEAEADTYSAHPGFSEHQTGLAVDINAASRSARFENTRAYAWLSENCWRYGFILRYPEGAQDITGFTFEPWHYRYVGPGTAALVHTSGLTYDEYVARRPVERADAALALNGVELTADAVTLNGTCWLPVQALAGGLGMRADLSGDRLSLSGPQGAVTLTAGSLAGQRNGQAAALTALPFVRDGQFYLSLDDLEGLLDLTVQQEGSHIWLTVPPAAQTPAAPAPEGAELPLRWI